MFRTIVTEILCCMKLKKLICLLKFLTMQRKAPPYCINGAVKWESSKQLKLIGQHETWVDTEEEDQGD